MGRNRRNEQRNFNKHFGNKDRNRARKSDWTGNNSRNEEIYKKQRIDEDEDDTYKDDSVDNDSNSDNEDFPSRKLKGKEIGLFYKNRQKQRNAHDKSFRKKNIMFKPVKLSISEQNKKEIQEIIQDVKIGNSNVQFKDSKNKYDHITESAFKTNFLKTISESFDEKLKNSLRDNYLNENAELDIELRNELINKEMYDAKYQEMLKYRQKLPAFQCKDKILQILEENQVVVISGETGCGKTTQVAQFILDDFIMKSRGSKCKIVCTQPRRISAVSIAERVAEEKNENVGQGYAGYNIRLEKKLPRECGSITFCTTGVLLFQMQENIVLKGISHLILDEIHERCVESDILITIVKDVIEKRKDLKVILMSATLNAEKFSKYFNGAPHINIPGFTYPVEEYFLEDVLEIINFRFPWPAESKKLGWRRYLKKNKVLEKNNVYAHFIEPYARQLEREGKYSRKVIEDIRNPESERLNLELIRELIIYINRTKPEGAILVFLPGLSDIASLQRLLQESPHMPKTDLIIPLHSKLETTQQKIIFRRPPSGVRKIIIATNIAETSITIDDVVYVIDAGRIKLTRYDIENDIETLKPEFESLANASQRRGRAGRVQPGVCYHLYSKARHMALDAYQEPEMIRIRLDEVILRLKILQIGKVEPFFMKTLDVPSTKAIETSLVLLKRLNALDDDELLTPLGYHLARLPMDPRSGKLILLAAMFSCIDPIFSIAASLSFRDAFFTPIGKDKQVLEKKSELSNGSRSDHLLFANAFARWENTSNWREAKDFCYEYFLNYNTINLLKDMKQQFANYLYEMNFLPNANLKDPKSNINSNNTSLLRAIICAGLYPNVAVIRRCEVKRTLIQDIRTPEDGKVKLFPVTINSIEVSFPSQFLVYHMKLKSTSIYLHDSTMVHPFPLIFFCDKFEIDSDVLDQQTTSSTNEIVLKIADVIKFKCSQNDLDLITDLRKKLNLLLEYKVAHPGFINWNNDNDETKILRAMMHLITAEDVEDSEF